MLNLFFRKDRKMTETTHTFRSYDGTMLDGTYNPSVKLKAAVMLVHGITSNRDELGFYSDMAKAFAEANIASFRFDYRCHGVNNSPMPELTLSGILNDIHAAFSQMETLAGKKIPKYIVGTSFGGGLSAYWASHNPDKLKALFLCAPVIDYQDDVLARMGFVEKGQLNTEGAKSLATQGFILSDGIRFGRTLINELPYLNGISALQALTCKVVVFHGDADTSVPLASSKRYLGNGRNRKLVVIKDVGHGFGVEGDENLSFPETKAHHHTIYKEMINIIHSF